MSNVKSILRNTLRSALAACVIVALTVMIMAALPQTAPNPTPQAPPIIDGSRTPDGIPDEVAYSLILLTASARKEASNIERLRAQTFTAAMPILQREHLIVTEIAAAFRRGSEEALLAGPASGGPERRRALTQNAIAALNARLESVSVSRFSLFLGNAKRSMKMFPLPKMGPQAAVVRPWDRLAQMFSLPIVYAHSMPPYPYSSTYTSLTHDANGIFYATGTTNAFSACNCHTTYAWVRVTMPDGRTSGSTDPSSLELAQATASISNDFAQGTVQAITSHSAYCPIGGGTFAVEDTAASACTSN